MSLDKEFFLFVASVVIQYSFFSAGRTSDAPVQAEGKKQDISWVFRLKSIHISIDFQYGTAAVRKLVRKYTALINLRDRMRLQN